MLVFVRCVLILHKFRPDFSPYRLYYPVKKRRQNRHSDSTGISIFLQPANQLPYKERP